MKRFHWFEIALVVAVMLIHAWAAFSAAHNFPQAWFTRDDAYFYFKTAQNISAGRGSTFDGLSLTNGYHPLWMLVCIPVFALARFDLILPLRLLVLLLGALSAVSGVLIFRLIRRVLFEPLAMLAAAFWVFNSFIHSAVTRFGLETGLLVIAVLFLLRRLQVFEARSQAQPVKLKEIALLAAAAVFVFLSRLDMIFLAGLVGLWIILRGTPLRYYLLTDALLTTSSVLLGFALRLGLPAYYPYSTTALLMAAGVLLLRLPLLYFLGLDDRPSRRKPPQVLLRLALAVVASSGLAALALLALGSRLPGFPRTVVFIEVALSFVLLAAVRLGARWFHPGQAPAAPAVDWKRIFREGLVFYAILGGVLAAYMLYNLAAFGTSTPVSGQVKRWWAAPLNQARGGPARTPEAFLGVDFDSDFEAWPLITRPLANLSVWIRKELRPPGLRLQNIYHIVLLLAALATLAVISAGRRRSLRAVQRLGLIPLFAGCGFQVLSYNAAGYSAVKEWYWAGQMLISLFLVALLADLLLRRLLQRQQIRGILIAEVAAICLLWYGIFAFDIFKSMPLVDARAGQPYVDAQAFLEKNTEPGSIIGMTGGGNVGYFIRERTIVNMDGLINSHAYFEALQAGQAADFLQAIGVDYVFANPQILNQLAPFNTQFRGRLVPLGKVYGNKELSRIRQAIP